jgi:hypothetical protein
MPLPTKNYNLLKLNPRLAREWHPTRNGTLSPAHFAPCSNKKVWWRCKKGHVWRAMIQERHKGGTGCPYCSSPPRAVCADTCLATRNPKLAKEWHPRKNGTLTPRDVTAGSSKKIWWRCTKGHSWQAAVGIRNKGHGCPYCSGLKPDKHTNLAAVNPLLAREWHPTRNAPLTPRDVTAYSNKRYWWRCKSGHEWQATLSNRNHAGHNCPYCAHQAVTAQTSFARLFPAAAKEWHPTKNGTLTAKDVMPATHKKVWWRCGNGHEWRAAVANRSKGCGCPYCSDPPRRLSPEKSLARINPALAKEWHPTMNGGLTPDDVFANCGKKAWWLCKYGHVWAAVIASRNGNARGCPDCYRDKQRGIKRKLRKSLRRKGNVRTAG